jgi:hypothetical protein
MSPGDLVVCVNAKPMAGCHNSPDLALLTEGHSYTVREAIPWNLGRVGISLDGVPLYLFDSRRFRHVRAPERIEAGDMTREQFIEVASDLIEEAIMRAQGIGDDGSREPQPDRRREGRASDRSDAACKTEGNSMILSARVGPHCNFCSRDPEDSDWLLGEKRPLICADCLTEFAPDCNAIRAHKSGVEAVRRELFPEEAREAA